MCDSLVKPQTKRQKQFASLLRDIVAHQVRLHVPQTVATAQTFFSIGPVTVSPDLRNAKVEILCDASSIDQNLKKINHYTVVIRKNVAAALKTKYVPKIHFVKSTSFSMDHADHTMHSVSF